MEIVNETLKDVINEKEILVRSNNKEISHILIDIGDKTLTNSVDNIDSIFLKWKMIYDFLSDRCGFYRIETPNDIHEYRNKVIEILEKDNNEIVEVQTLIENSRSSEEEIKDIVEQYEIDHDINTEPGQIQAQRSLILRDIAMVNRKIQDLCKWRFGEPDDFIKKLSIICHNDNNIEDPELLEILGKAKNMLEELEMGCIISFGFRLHEDRIKKAIRKTRKELGREFVYLGEFKVVFLPFFRIITKKDHPLRRTWDDFLRVARTVYVGRFSSEPLILMIDRNRLKLTSIEEARIDHSKEYTDFPWEEFYPLGEDVVKKEPNPISIQEAKSLTAQIEEVYEIEKEWKEVFIPFISVKVIDKSSSALEELIISPFTYDVMRIEQGGDN